MKRLLRAAGVTMLRQLLVMACQLGTVVMVARALGPAGNGAWAAIMLLPGLLATLLNPGVAPAIIYFIAGRHLGAAQLRAVLRRLALLLSIAGLLLGGLLVWLAGDWLFADEPRPLLLAALLLFPLQLVQSWHIALLQGAQRFRTMNLLLLMPAVLSLLLVTAWFLDGRHALAALLAISLLVAVSGTLAALLLARRVQTPAVATPLAPTPTRAVLDYGLRSHAGNLVAYLNYRADFYVVLALTGPVATGLYALAVQLAEKLFVVSQSAAAVLLPTLAAMRDQPARRLELVAFSARWSFLLTALASMVLVLLVWQFGTALFGDGYAAVPGVLLLLVAGVAATGYSRVLANDIAAQGRPGLNAWTGLAAALANLLLALWLVPAQGIAGAALASTMAYLLNSVLKVWTFCFLNRCSPRLLLSLAPERAWLAARRQAAP